MGHYTRVTQAVSRMARKPAKRFAQLCRQLEREAVMQVEKACLLSVSVAGALVPDAHVGYGLLIGGVVAT